MSLMNQIYPSSYKQKTLHLCRTWWCERDEIIL